MEAKKVIILLLTLTCVVSHASFARQAIPDRGDFELVISAGGNDAEREIEEYLLEYGDIEDLLHGMNAALNLGEQVVVEFMTWHYPMATYDSLDHKIMISYPYVSKIKELFQGDADHWYPVVEQTVLHEAGHALINVNNIPLDDDENPEVAADELAFLIMSEFYDSEALRPVVEHYRFRNKQTESTEVASISSHLPDKHRASLYLCWIIGKNPEFADEVKDDLESGDLDLCVSEYNKLKDAWGYRLGPSWKRSS